MGTKSLVMMLKIDIDSISMVHGNMLWALGSMWVFFFNCVFSSLVLILRYIFRFLVEDRKAENHVQPALADQTKKSQFEDSEIDEFAEKLSNFLFPSSGEFYVADEEIEGETECSVFVEATVSDDVLNESKSEEEKETESSFSKQSEGEAECSVFKEKGPDIHEVSKESEGEVECSVFKEKSPDIHEVYRESEGGETEGSVFTETVPDFHGDVKRVDEIETDCSVSMMESDSNVHEEETERSLFMYSNFSTTTSKYQFMSRKDISCFEEEPSSLTFSFRHFYTSPNVSAVSSDDNAIPSTANSSNKEFSDGIVSQEEEEESVQEQRTLNSCSYVDEHNDHCEQGFESESLKTKKEEKVEDVEETPVSSDGKVSHGLVHEDIEKDGSNHEHEEETMWEENFDESDYEEEEDDDDDDDDLDWGDEDDDEDDELLQQMKLELRIAKQGGLATILEDEYDEEEETEFPKFVGDLKPLSLKIEEKLEYKGQMVEIQKVYKSYADKMRKLDILNYQTMNAIGLLQLKEPPKLILMPKSTAQGGKPLIYQNLWSRKAQKHKSDPMVKFVHELHGDLELVYVGHVCLSWEILCWQHKKANELQQFDSQWPRRYNLVAGEFQLFQVLIHRFLENEPFHQGPRNRIQNYVKNRCIIRNLLHVPAIKDDNKKDKKIMNLGEEEDAMIASGRLVEIIKESMHVFWEFVRADKDYGNVIPKVSKRIGNDDVDDPEISDLLVEIRAQLHKKERKLKEIVRSGSCIVRKFQKHHNEDEVELNHEQLLAQVGLRLVSRVVNMKRLRKDQLLWCNEKLNRINFVGRKIQVEPSFLLFPC